MSRCVLGWDIGGVNAKVARAGGGDILLARSRAFELQRDPPALAQVLRELAAEVGVPLSRSPSLSCAVTMTAELSQIFRTKREGVHFVLAAVEAAFPDADILVFTVDGRFVRPADARGNPMAVAAANWAATARLVASRYPTALLIDVGTTTTDIVPIVRGAVAAVGTTDPDRLASGELVYTGALRTPVEAIVDAVPYREGHARVSAEGFALAGDVHVWRGCLAAEDYSVRTPDGRPATRPFAGERLARIICADRELLDEADVDRVADAVAAGQVATIASSIRHVARAHPEIRTAVVTGLGAFIAEAAVREAGLDVVTLAAELGEDAARYAPAVAVAVLCPDGPAEVGHHDTAGEVWLQREPARRDVRLQAGPVPLPQNSAIVIKVGGGLLSHVQHFARVAQALCELGRTQRVLVIPGGGPFADVVRDVDERLHAGDDAAHWMAILGMDQHAHVLASRIANSVIVATVDEVAQAMRDRRVPVLAPSRWVGRADPLPHTWDVTSDSIAAWCAGQIGASTLVLVKPPGAQGADLVDPSFQRTLPPGIACHIVSADDAPMFFATKITKG